MSLLDLNEEQFDLKEYIEKNIKEFIFKYYNFGGFKQGYVGIQNYYIFEGDNFEFIYKCNNIMKSHILISKINIPTCKLMWRITITDSMGYTWRDGKPLLAERINFNEKVDVEYILNYMKNESIGYK